MARNNTNTERTRNVGDFKVGLDKAYGEGDTRRVLYFASQVLRQVTSNAGCIKTTTAEQRKAFAADAADAIANVIPAIAGLTDTDVRRSGSASNAADKAKIAEQAAALASQAAIIAELQAAVAALTAKVAPTPTPTPAPKAAAPRGKAATASAVPEAKPAAPAPARGLFAAR